MNMNEQTVSPAGASDALARHHALMHTMLSNLDIGALRLMAADLSAIGDTLRADIRAKKELHFSTASIGIEEVSYADFRQAAEYLNRILSVLS
jgi:hypothetical protein